MREKINLSGITWDHPRGYEAIRAVSEVFCEKHPGVEIRWDVRSLKDFGDYPVTLLAENYDLIMLDHPHLGSAVRARALVPLDVCMDCLLYTSRWCGQFDPSGNGHHAVQEYPE